ncbi:ankyrin repeat-containing domain protein [Penicillium sp. DV-2018c]|nr:ankyrin repeat-containing domain protein [Penicillium sp. DV-2018c]
MDPVSVRASAIAIATLAAQTCTALSDLRSLCQSLPGRLHAVNNEVADLNLVLSQVSLLIEDRASLPESAVSAIPHLLKQADRQLVEIKDLVCQLTVACRTSRVPIFRGHAWQKEQSRLQSLQEEIRTVKANLNIISGASNSYVFELLFLNCRQPLTFANDENSQDMTKIRLRIETISLESLQQEVTLKDNFLRGLAAVDQRIATVEDLLRAQSHQTQASQFTQVGTSYHMSTARRQRPSPIKKERQPTTAQSEGIGIRVTPFVVTCRTGCPCSSHVQQRTTSPTLLNRVFGQLFVGYAGLPIFSPKCDLNACRKSRASQVSLEYWFPLAFLSSTILRFQLGYQPNIGTLLQLDTLRRVPDTAQCVSFALNGDIDGLKYLFKSGLASPRDVSTTRGYSVLRWALYGKQYETCKFLIHAGADADYRPIAGSDNSPRNKACHFLLEGGLSGNAVGALRFITKDGFLEDFIDEARFTRIHKIVLDLSKLSLEDEIYRSPQDINAVDAMGRTPLAWAAARGDTRAIVRLLSHGADPNIIDVQLSGPLSNAASQGHTVAVRLLLEAGAQTDLIHPSGEKKGSALNCATRNATDISLLKSLLDFGADVDASGNDGKTALTHAARTDNASFAMLLLEYGADINAVSADGSTPLTTAITYNSHNVLRLILNRWHEYSVCPRLKGPDLLQIAALYADPETLRILAATDHLRMKYDDQYTLRDLGDRLRRRPDLTDDLALSFDNLLRVSRQVSEQRRERFQSFVDRSVFPCCLSRVSSDLTEKDLKGTCSAGESFRGALERLPLMTDDPATMA